MSILRTTITRTIKRTRIRATDSVTLTTAREMTVRMLAVALGRPLDLRWLLL